MKKILTLIFVLAMCLCLFSCGDDEVPDGMKLASNTDIVDYKLFVPEAWVVSNADRAATQAFASEDDRTNVIVEQWNITENTKNVADWWEKEYKPQVFTSGAIQDPVVKKDKEGKEGVNITLGGKAATKYTYTGKIGDAYFRYDVIGCVTNGSIYVIHFTYMQDGVKEGEKITYSAVDTHKDAVQAIIDNFRFD